MAPVKHAISEHDVVELREGASGWPAGTVGTVISVYDGVLLVEIASPRGKTLDTIQVPTALLEPKHH
jgi:hypothetical protein